MSTVDEDQRLPADVVPRNDPARAGEPGAALVTGATGFLGAAVVAELVEHTEQRVYCLVRPEDGTAQERIEAALRYYDLWRDTWSDRVIGLAGDLARPGCGLSETDRRIVVAETDTVYHCGAGVNVSYPYEALRGPNVSGTVEVLRLVCAGRPKRLAHVSTVSVLYGHSLEGAEGPGVVEDFAELGPAGALGGYGLSKWAAERLVVQARERGVDALVFRSGTLAGHTRTGVSNPNDYAWLFLRTCAAMGAAPLAGSPLQWAPVDYAARAVVRLTRTSDGSAPPAYHLMAPEQTRYTTLFSWMRRFGYHLRPADFALWRRRVLDASVTSERDELRQIAATLPDAAAGSAAVVPDVACDRTDAELAKLGVRCPVLDEPLARLYLRVGLERAELPAPDRVAAAS
ncbi:thioester reductase domain-containing protein [Streptomyces sp. SID3343]|uniref:thioester reductase domain-containing protein n=1 Tax=Streptomyces sp. SID3343 TaxID=2690260 RepID=UPI00136CA16C|nr:thioester reductase domain-containing protein [Streptomyces sp. SID3343]MYW01562.1 NAD-dependent epimerase/dehydratase family protein [Streptomyces sp. SID3343]